MLIQDLGKPIGRSVNLYAWGETQVLKLYDVDVPRDFIIATGEKEKALHALGLPVPELGALVEIEGQLGQVYERIVGRTFADEMLTVANADEECIERLAIQFGEAQAKIHAVDNHGIHLPRQKEILSAVIDRLALLTPALKTAVQARLAALPDGNRICHGDYHPFNLIQSPRGTVVIDWNNAHAGNPMEDLARTTLMSVGFGRMMPEVAEAVECFIDVSLARYFEVSGAQRAQMDAWWPAVCAVRLADPVVELHPWLLAQVEEGLG